MAMVNGVKQCSACGGVGGTYRNDDTHRMDICIYCNGMGVVDGPIYVPDGKHSTRRSSKSDLPILLFLVVGGYVWFKSEDYLLAFIAALISGWFGQTRIGSTIIKFAFLVFIGWVVLQFINSIDTFY